MSFEDLSGRIWIENKTIHYKTPNGGWEIPISEIRIVGEHTNQSGPAVDYFFIFLTASGGYEASFYAEGRESLLMELGQQLDSQLDCRLVNSTNFKSRIMWPPEMQDKALFDYTPAPKPKGIWARIKHAILPMMNYRLTDEVKGRMGW
jgi:hypothetical protein